MTCVISVTDHTLVSDDKEAGPYGPAAKEAKIRKMRSYPFTRTSFS